MKVKPGTKLRSRNAAYQQRHRDKKVPVAFSQQRGNSAAWMCLVWMCPACYPATTTSKCLQLRLGTSCGNRRRKRLEWKMSGIKRKWNWALKWKRKQATDARVSFHSTLRLQGWDWRLSSTAAESSPSCSSQCVHCQICSVLLWDHFKLRSSPKQERDEDILSMGMGARAWGRAKNSLFQLCSLVLLAWLYLCKPNQARWQPVAAAQLSGGTVPMR